MECMDNYILNSEPNGTQLGVGSLGKIHEILSPPPKRSNKTASLRTERYRLQGFARDLLCEHARSKGLSLDLYPRQTKCMRTRIGSGLVSVKKSNVFKTAFYDGLVICGSVWTCPVCSAKIQERRRVELLSLFDWAYNKIKGKKVIMVTLTFPHHAWNSLPELLTQQADALKRLRMGSPWGRVKKQSGYSGMVRALELTHGDNGWHPHTHELWVVDKNCDASWLKEKILERWAIACEKAGLLTEEKRPFFMKRAVDLHDNAKCGEYLAKYDESCYWGADREIAKASTKAGKGNGRHPFKILSDASKGCLISRNLFLDFTAAIKGKRQLHWSAGLKGLVGLNEKSDLELATEKQDDCVLLAVLERRHWDIVLANSARAIILGIAEESGYSGLREWFLSKGLDLPRPPP